MASDHDTISIHSSSVQGYHGDDDDDDHPHSHHLSRLSMCNNTTTTTTTTNNNNNVVKHSSQLEAGDEDEDMSIYISRLSIEGEGSDDDDGDADEEFSDSKEGYANKARGGGLDSVLSSDSDREIGCLSLPATPPRRRNRRGFTLNQSSSSNIIGAKEYASENEAAPPNKDSSSSTGIFRNSSKMRGNPKSRRSSFFNRERWFERANWEKKKMQSDDNMFEHENDQSLFMITRPRGGSRSLCMDLGEVKACRDLGFELEHERLEIPTGISISAACSTIDTSSGGNSPISSWRISSPGDDPKDVKARLKVWAQAVALVSSSPPRQYSPN